MKRANLWLLIVCLAFIAGLLMLAIMERVAKKLPGPDAIDSPPSKDEPRISPDRPAVAQPADTGTGADFSGHPDALAIGTDAIPPEREPAVLLDFLQAYRREFGTFPTGNENAHFLNALAGSNPSGLVIFPIHHPRVSPVGELMDAWDRPFHFHLIDRHHIEVRSAGPDGELFTTDDIMAPHSANRENAVGEAER